jgi:hypothetical protein
MKTKMKMKAITLGERHILLLQEKANKYNLTFSELLRRLIDKYLEDESKKDKEIGQ